MTKKSVSNYASVIKEQAVLQETLVMYNAKVHGMLELILEINLAGLSARKAGFLHDALCAISEMVNTNRELSEKMLDRLLKIIVETEDEALDGSTNNDEALKTTPLAGDLL